MRMIRKIWGLSGREQLLLLQLFALFPLVRLGLKLLPFKTVVSLLPGKRSLDGSEAWTELRSADRLAYLIEAASRRHFLKPSCLEKGLILSGIMRKRGLESDLRIGTSKTNGAFKAHAWVEYRGQVILGGAVEGYAPLLSAESVGSQSQLA